ncbi:MAG: argininosuccinate lyase, partial [Acidobacteriota bacterium]|nr:argininosuccinate lyase [Acidobacteriota bacterium]
MIGPLGGKLHTARSRNDQVALDLRLWLKRELAALDGEVSALVDALLERIEDEGRVLMPGYTHLQRGQPILLGHHLLAHAWPLARDRRRLREALEALDFCPLGAGALAGSPHRVDRRASARRGGFRAPVPNAMDAVAARDHVQQTVAACAVLMSHLSRMAAEMVLWSSTEFGFLRLGDAYTTGSSIMPQKRNPDAAELIRGKAARVFGDLQALLTLTHGLPLSYFRDLQEDRHALFDALGTSRQCVRIMEGMWRTSRFVAERFEKRAGGRLQPGHGTGRLPGHPGGSLPRGPWLRGTPGQGPRRGGRRPVGPRPGPRPAIPPRARRRSLRVARSPRRRRTTLSRGGHGLVPGRTATRPAAAGVAPSPRRRRSFRNGLLADSGVPARSGQGQQGLAQAARPHQVLDGVGGENVPHGPRGQGVDHARLALAGAVAAPRIHHAAHDAYRPQSRLDHRGQVDGLRRPGQAITPSPPRHAHEQTRTLEGDG